MPYSDVSSARKSIPSLKNLSDKQVRVFIRVFNSLVKDGEKESEAIPKAIAAAKRVDKSMDIEKRLEQIQVTVSMQEFLRKFFGLYWDDAEALTKLLGFQTEYEDEVSEAYDHEEYMEERIAGFKIISKAALQDDFSGVTLGQYEALKSLVDNREKSKGKLESIIISVLDKYFKTPNQNLEVVKALNESELSIIEPFTQGPSKVDGHGDIYLAEDIEHLVASANKLKPSMNLFHKYMIDDVTFEKAWVQPYDIKLQTPFGEKVIPEGTAMGKFVFKNKKAFDYRVSKKLMGISIGARATDFEDIEKSSDSALSTIVGAKRRIVKPHFDRPNAHFAYTSASNPAASLENDYVQVNKSLMAPLTDEEKEIVIGLGHDLSEVAKSLEASEKTPGDSSPVGEKTGEEPKENPTKGNDTKMSDEIQKKLEDENAELKKQLKAMKVQTQEAELKEFGFDGDLLKSLCDVLVDFSGRDKVIEGFSTLFAKVGEVAGELDTAKADLEKSKTEKPENEIAKALQQEEGHAEKQEPTLSGTDLVIQKAKQRAQELKKQGAK